MAAPPTTQQLQLDLPDDTTTSPSDWFGPALPALNKFLGDTQYALQKNLTRAQNLASQVYVLDFTTGAAPPYTATFTCSLKTQPEEIKVVKKEGLKNQAGVAATFSGATECHNWSLSTGKNTSGTTVTINEITGLNPSSHYRITIHVY